MKCKCSFLLSIGLFIVLIQSNAVLAEENKMDQTLLIDTLITLLDPYISKEIEHYYGYQKSYGLYDAKILNLSREEENEFSFNVKVQVNTFEEAHNPPYGQETIILEVDMDKVNVTRFIHEGDDWERKVMNFYDEVITDIAHTFSLDLQSFKKYSYEQLMFLAEKQKEYTSLSEIVTDIEVNQLTPEINTPYTPYKNIIKPVTFIREDHGFILFKHADGTNVVVEVAKLNGIWVEINKEKKEGKKMENELLWYM